MMSRATQSVDGYRRAKRYAVILAGGLGTRFWPQSRRELPKQFLPIRGQSSLLQNTVRRLKGLVPLDQTLVVAAREYADLIQSQLPDLPSTSVLIEPSARGTAACVALAAACIARRDPQGLMAVFPADHVITNLQQFRRAVRTAFATAARHECLVVFGIPPRGLDTGYGYVERGRPWRGTTPRVYSAVGFHEKPDVRTARAYVAAGRHLWNSGMFVWRVDVIWKALERYAPAIARAVRHPWLARGRRRSTATAYRAYRRLPAVSIDVAVMERAERIAIIEGDFGWNDVGSWAAMASIWGTDATGNARRGKTVVIDSHDTVVYGAERLIAVLGARDLVVVDSPGAVLVCPKSRTQEIRRIVDALAHSRRRYLL